jgi:hypothetical protein
MRSGGEASPWSQAQLDVLNVGGTLDEQYSRGIELLEGVVAMLTQLIYP